MISPSFICMLLGLTIYIGFVCRLVYLNVKFKTEFAVDKQNTSDRVVWSVALSLLGLVLFAGGGIAMLLT
jgi:hypothetical protein